MDGARRRGRGRDVVGVKRSAPHPVGAKLAISDAGTVAGAVSGGRVESAVVQVADRILRGGAPELLHRRRAPRPRGRTPKHTSGRIHEVVA